MPQFPGLPPHPAPEVELGLETDYDLTGLWLRARDPLTLHATWELPRAVRTLPGTRLCLRVRLGPDPLARFQEIEVPPGARSVFIPAEEPDTLYVAEIGLAGPGDTWQSLARSAPARTPPQEGPETETVQFVTVALVPEEVPPTSEEAASAATTIPAPVPAPLPAEPPAAADRSIESLFQPDTLAPYPPAPTPPPPPTAFPEAGITPPTALPAEPEPAALAPDVISPPAALAYEPPPSPADTLAAPAAPAPPGPVALPAPPPAASGTVSSSPAAASRPSERPAPRRGPAKAAPFSPGRRVQLIEMPTPVWSPVQAASLQELFPPGLMAPSSGELAGAPGWAARAGWPEPHGGARGPLAGPWSSEAAVPLPVPSGRGFWFNVNAELIVYGATEPDAKVTIEGEPIALRADGSFTLRFALPDGEYALRATAVAAAGDEARTARLAFRRQTAYVGEVGPHPTDPRLPLPPTGMETP